MAIASELTREELEAALREVPAMSAASGGCRIEQIIGYYRDLLDPPRIKRRSCPACATEWTGPADLTCPTSSELDERVAREVAETLGAGLNEDIWDALDDAHENNARHYHAAECCWPFRGSSQAITEALTARVPSRRRTQ